MTKAKDPKPPRPKRAGPATKTNPTTGAFQISDELWEVLAPLIPKHVNTHRFGGGRPRVPDRTCANGIDRRDTTQIWATDYVDMLTYVPVASYRRVGHPQKVSASLQNRCTAIWPRSPKSPSSLGPRSPKK